MSDTKQLPTILEPTNRTELLRLVREAGESHLSPAQTALRLSISDKECQILWWEDAEVAATYAMAHLEQQINYLKNVKEIANNSDPDNKQRFAASKYLYELFSGNKSTQNNTFNISVKNMHPDASKIQNSIKLIEALDATTVEKISND